MRKKAIAVDWSAAGLHWIRAEKSNDSWSVVQTLFCPWPVLEPAPSRLRNPLTVAPCLKEFVEKNGLKKERVLLSLPRSEFFFHWVDCSPQELNKAAEQEFPLPLAELYWLGTRVSSSNDSTTHFLAGVPQARVDQYRQALAAAGVSLRGIGLHPLAQLHTLQTHKPTATNGKPFLLVDMATPEIQVILAQGESPLFCRGFSLGENTAASSLAHDSWVNNLAEELKKTGEIIQRTKKLQGTPPIYLAAEKSLPAGLPEQLSSLLRVPVDVVHLHESLSWGALGLILALGKTNSSWILPPASPRSELRKKWARHRSSILAGISLGLVAISLILGEINAREEIQLRRLTKEANQRTSSSRITSHAARAPDPFLDIFLEVARQVPSKSHLVDFNYDAAQKTLTLRGRAANYALVSSLVNGLGQSPHFQEVHGNKASLATIGGQSVVEFSVEGNLR